MFKHYLSEIDGVAIYPIISLTIFISFFVALGYWVFKANNGYIKHMEELPLGNDIK
jgi:cytochrome c oxidase cbb3-type subunit IV